MQLHHREAVLSSHLSRNEAQVLHPAVSLFGEFAQVRCVERSFIEDGDFSRIVFDDSQGHRGPFVPYPA